MCVDSATWLFGQLYTRQQRVGSVLYILTRLYKRVNLYKNKTSNYTYSDQFYCSLRTLKWKATMGLSPSILSLSLSLFLPSYVSHSPDIALIVQSYKQVRHVYFFFLLFFSCFVMLLVVVVVLLLVAASSRSHTHTHTLTRSRHRIYIAAHYHSSNLNSNQTSHYFFFFFSLSPSSFTART